MHHTHDKHDNSKVTAIWFLISSSWQWCSFFFFFRWIWWIKGKIVDLQSHSCNSKWWIKDDKEGKTLHLFIKSNIPIKFLYNGSIIWIWPISEWRDICWIYNCYQNIQMWRNSTISIFWPNTGNSYKSISILRLIDWCSLADMLNKFKHFLILLSVKEIWNNTEKWTSPVLRRLQKYQAISEMTVAAATDPPM